MTPSRIFLYFCLSFIVGIFFSSMIFIPQLVMLGFLILAALLIFVLWHYKKIVVFGFCLLFFAAGIWRYQVAELRIMNDELRGYNDISEKVTLTGVVLKEPDIRENSTKLTVNVTEIQFVLSPKMAEVRPLPFLGKVLVTTNRYPEYEYGDKIEMTGELKTPPRFEGFNYQNYLAKEGIYSVMDWPKIEIVGKGFGNPLMRTLFSFKNKFQETVRVFISPPQEGFLEALVFGEENNISKEWKEKLNNTGTRHIAAVSGMNITIISFLILNFFLYLGLWRNQAFYLSVFLIILYILMIGAPASAIRAGIMGVLLMTATYFGRLSTASRAVTFAAFFMLLSNPFLLRFDVGFQLSFLAILGMIYLQPIIFEWFKGVPNPKLFSLQSVLSATLSAQFFTLPILIYNFGRIPLISPLANILIVPFLAPITILIFVFGVAGMIFPPLGLALCLPAWLFLTYIVAIIDWFSKIPFASLVLEDIYFFKNFLTLGGISESIHWLWLFVIYLVIGLIAWRLQEAYKLKFLKY